MLEVGPGLLCFKMIINFHFRKEIRYDKMSKTQDNQTVESEDHDLNDSTGNYCFTGIEVRNNCSESDKNKIDKIRMLWRYVNILCLLYA